MSSRNIRAGVKHLHVEKWNLKKGKKQLRSGGTCTTEGYKDVKVIRNMKKEPAS